ncbi:MAG: hypothetical protein HQL72_09395 [Magnetococcales bacterium]|nr:hypothetical protein [Magnetococcales bacterium]
MSGTIGLIAPQLPNTMGNKGGDGGVHIHLGSSEYQFNQVLDLVAPHSGAMSEPMMEDNPELLDTQSLEQVATLMGKRPEGGSRWKQLASASQRGFGNGVAHVMPTNLVRSAYQIYSSTSSQPVDQIKKAGDGVSPPGIIDFSH